LSRRRTCLIALGASVVALTALAGCGGGGGGGANSSTVAESQLQAAHKAGEEAAHERDRVDSLQKQVSKLRHQVQHGASSASDGGQATTVGSESPSGEPSGEVMRAFHVASGNVSCEVLDGGAICTVEPISQTFVFQDGEPARTEQSAVLPKDLGELVPYGSTVAAGSISCEIPPSNVPHGIICSDSSSGHGFEASRVSARQNVY
jgi:hypothetical protein